MAKKRKTENQNGSGVEKTAEPEQLREQMQMLNFDLRLVLSDVDDLLQVMQRMTKHLKEIANEINDK